jgi:hypothetical protein
MYLYIYLSCLLAVRSILFYIKQGNHKKSWTVSCFVDTKFWKLQFDLNVCADFQLSLIMYIWLQRDNLYRIIFSDTLNCSGGTRWRSRFRHCGTIRKVAGSIPDGVIGIFHWHHPSGHTMAMGSTQPLIEMSTRNISWGRGGRCVRLPTLPPSCADCHEIWEPQPPGTLKACPGL